MKFDHELVDTVYKYKINKVNHVIVAIILLFFALILLSIITGSADYSDYQTVAGFFGSWILFVGLGIVACGGYFAWAILGKNATSFKQHSLHDIKNMYKEVITERVNDSQFAKYAKEHTEHEECLGIALIHVAMD